MQNVCDLALTNHLAYSGIVIIFIITTRTRTKKSPTVDRPVVDTTRIKWWIWYRRYLAALSRKLTIRGCHAVFYHGLLIKVSLDTRHFCNSLPKKKTGFRVVSEIRPYLLAFVGRGLSMFVSVCLEAMRVSDENRTSCNALKCMNLFFCFVPLIQKSLYPVEIVRILMVFRFFFSGCRSQ